MNFPDVTLSTRTKNVFLSGTHLLHEFCLSTHFCWTNVACDLSIQSSCQEELCSFKHRLTGNYTHLSSNY